MNQDQQQKHIVVLSSVIGYDPGTSKPRSYIGGVVEESGLGLPVTVCADLDSYVIGFDKRPNDVGVLIVDMSRGNPWNVMLSLRKSALIPEPLRTVPVIGTYYSEEIPAKFQELSAQYGIRQLVPVGRRPFYGASDKINARHVAALREALDKELISLSTPVRSPDQTGASPKERGAREPS